MEAKYQKSNFIRVASADSVRGQSLIEIIIALTVGGALIAAGAGAIALVLSSNMESKSFQAASLLNQGLLDDVKIAAEANWHNLDDKTLDGVAQYYVAASTTNPSALWVFNGATTTVQDNASFTKYFVLEKVSRDSGQNVEVIYNEANRDPSTLKITALVSWTRFNKTKTVSNSLYLTRWKNLIFQQTDWLGGL